MVGQPLDLLRQPLPCKDLNGLRNAGMEHAPPLQQETAIGHLVGEGMLEGVFTLGEQAGLIEKLGGL